MRIVETVAVKSKLIDNAIGFAFMLIVAAVVVMFWGLLASVADAAPRCSTGFCAKQAVVHQQVAVAAIPYPVVGYQVGQHLQQQAVDEYGFRASPSKERLTFLEGYYQAKQEELQPTDSGDRPTGPHQPPSEGHDATDGGQTTPPVFSAPMPPTAPPAFAETHPQLNASCAACHSGETPKGELRIAEAVTAAQANADANAILEIITPVAFRTMPQGKEMTDTQRVDAIAELLSK